MAAVDTGKSFANGEQLTAAKLNQMFGNSTFATGAVDNSTMTINSLGQLAVNQVTSSNIATNAINLDDIQQIDTDKVLGRTSAGTGNVEQVDIVGTNGILLDEDNLSSDSDTQGATQQSIKAYVDTTAAPTVGFVPTSYTGEESVTLPNGLIMKMGISASVGTDSSLTVEFGTDFNAAPITVQLTKLRGLATTGAGELTVDNVTASEFTIRNGLDTAGQVYWFAIGR